MLTGSLVAIVTPMKAGGALDLDALARLVDWHIQSGTSGIVVVGTTGESPTVDVDEHCLLIRTVVEHVRGRVHVMAGVGANATSEAIELTRYAKKVGADSGLSVVPYYNKPTQEGLYRHFRAIAEQVDLPIYLYNVPGRTVADLATETTLRLAQIPGIVGIKDATADLGRGSELLKGLAAAGKRDFSVLSGEDITALPLMFMGGHGVISVTANVAPALMERPEISAIEVVIDPYPTGKRKTWEVTMLQRIQQHRPLILNTVFPNYAECEWLLSQLDRRGLLFNARFAADAPDLPDDMPGSDAWLLA